MAIDILTLALAKKMSGDIEVTGASVGQTIVVKAVDENGKPTEWEVVDVVKTINGITPDENGNVEVTVSDGNVDLTGYATEQYVQDYAQPKGNYLTEHQDISGKLDASALPTAINTALAQAKASGEFDGKDGKDGSNGKDGVSATHSWNGTTLTIISVSGTSSANLKGDKGDKGDPGEKGDKGDTGAAGKDGKDYVLTASDKAEIVQAVLDELGG